MYSVYMTTAGRIAEAALHLLEAEGSEAVAMRRVAKSVGITPMAIYNHYPTRAALLEAITTQEVARLQSCIDTRRKQTGAAAKTKAILTDWMDGYLDYALSRPRVFDYVFSEAGPDALRFPEDFQARKLPILNPLADAVAEGMRAGTLRNEDVWEVALEIWAHVHGYVTLYRAGRFALSEDEFRALCRRSLKRLLNGLRN